MERNIFLKLAIFPQLSRRYWLPRYSKNFSSDSEDSSSSVSSMSSSMSFISQHDPHQIMNSCEVINYRVRYFRGRIPKFNQSEARKRCFLSSYWLKFGTLPRKYRTLL